MRPGRSNRSFLWIDSQNGLLTNNSNVVQQDISMSNEYNFYYPNGNTYITNNSVSTQWLSSVNISGVDDEPIDFPDGLKSEDIYYTNAYEYTTNQGMTHWNTVNFKESAAFESGLLTNTIEPNTDDTITINGNLIINDNLEVLGTTTSIATQNLVVEDNYINQNFGYSPNVARDSGTICVRLPNATTYTLSGNFVAGSISATDAFVATSAASGLSAGDIIQIVGSTTNSGIYEVLSHSSNILTVKGCLTAVSCNWVVENFNNEVATGFAQKIDISGLVFKANATGLEYINGSNTSAITSQNIVLNGTFPSFTSVYLTAITNDNSKTRVLCTDDATGQVYYRSANTLLPVANSTTTMACLATWSTDSASVSIKFRFDHMFEIVGLQIEDFSLDLTTAADFITIDVDPDVLPTRRMVLGPITIYNSALHEECNAVVDAGYLKIYRKDGSQFAIGTVSHCTQNLPGMSVAASCTQFDYTRF